MPGAMQKLSRLFILILLSALLFGCVAREVRTPTPTPLPAAPTSTPVPQPATYRETFDGSPAHPEAWRPANWDVTVHSRDTDTWEELEPMHAAHGPDCSPPPAAHTTSNYTQAVYRCKDHLMTAINASGYGAIYLTPGYLIDFADGMAVVQFDLSTLRTSQRDWIDLWISPYAEQLQLPLHDWGPDLSGEPRNAIHIRMDSVSGKTVFKAWVVRDFEATEIEGNWWTGYEEVLTPSAKQRDTFELRISQTRIQFGLPTYDFWWIDTAIPELAWSQGVVQLGHHSYNPTKDCDDCGANTWHWDNIVIDPAIPFSIIPAQRRFADEQAATVRFAQPAPAAAHLRFAGVGTDLEVRFGAGTTWQPAQLQDQERLVEEHFKSYWMPIPAGVTEVQFRGESWWGGGWHVRDLSIWSPELPASTAER